MILYACVASNGKILAEYDSGENLSSQALQCVLAAPKHHRFYTHTVQERTYAFLFDQGVKCKKPLVYFAISTESSSQETITFLERLCSSYKSETGGHDFSQLVASLMGDEKSRLPLPSASVRRELRLRKGDNEIDDDDGCGEHELEIIDCERNHGNVLSVDGKSSRETKWRRQVRVAVMIDLFICSALFVIWLSVCKGFECVRRL